MKRFLLISFIFLSQTMAYEPQPGILKANKAEVETVRVGIIGLGGRCQTTIHECLKLLPIVDKKLQIVAVVDDFSKKSLDRFVKIRAYDTPEKYRSLFQDAKYYPDTPKGLKEFFQHEFDLILITSINAKHKNQVLRALKSTKPTTRIHVKTPLVCTLKELEEINKHRADRDIELGLTLRFTEMTKTACQKLKEYQSALGPLRSVTSWDQPYCGHTLGIIMMNWRRYLSCSGGLLIDRSIHDVDLVLYMMMNALGIEPTSFSIKTNTGHELFKKSNLEMFQELLKCKEYRENAEIWAQKPWQHVIEYVYDSSGAIDWNATLEKIFKDLPPDNNFSKSDIIPDVHWFKTVINTNQGKVLYKHKTKLSTNLDHKRGCKFIFENGSVKLDIINTMMIIKIKKQSPIVINLKPDVPTKNQLHAAGDHFVALSILNALPPAHPRAPLSDPALQLSTFLTLLSENQARTQSHQLTEAFLQDNGQWTIQNVR